jgi:hypothetical protein
MIFVWFEIRLCIINRKCVIYLIVINYVPLEYLIDWKSKFCVKIRPQKILFSVFGVEYWSGKRMWVGNRLMISILRHITSRTFCVCSCKDDHIVYNSVCCRCIFHITAYLSEPFNSLHWYWIQSGGRTSVMKSSIGCR